MRGTGWGVKQDICWSVSQVRNSQLLLDNMDMRSHYLLRIQLLLGFGVVRCKSILFVSVRITSMVPVYLKITLVPVKWPWSTLHTTEWCTSDATLGKVEHLFWSLISSLATIRMKLETKICILLLTNNIDKILLTFLRILEYRMSKHNQERSIKENMKKMSLYTFFTCVVTYRTKLSMLLPIFDINVI